MGAPHVLWLDAIGPDDRPRVGAKAFTLALLRRQGLPIPEGFVLLAGNGLGPERRHALLEAYERLGERVAVRSSALAEDLPEASFAGQYRTVLDIRGNDALVAAVESCLASAPAAGAYAEAVGASGSPSMAVLVQRFVDPVAAGVVFTRHPRDPMGMLVEAHAGHGEAVLSGRVRPEPYLVERRTGLVRARPPTGPLRDEVVGEIARLALCTEELLGGPQDVEWALGPAGVVLLQERPITVEEEAARAPRRLTRANVGEVLPDPVTPLTESTVVAFLESAFREVLASVGLSAAGDAPFLALHRRRLYLDLDRCLEVARALPLTSAAGAERLILGSGAGASHPGPPRLEDLPALLRVGLALTRLARRLPDELAWLDEAVGGLGKLDLEDEPARLGPALRAFEAMGRRGAATHVALSGACALRLAALERVLASFAPGDPVARVNRLVAGLPDVESALPASALEEIAAEARDHPQWHAWLAQPTEEAARGLARGEAPAGLSERIAGFLERFGHRGLSEGELAAPTWRDDPLPLLRALQALARRAGRPGLGYRAAAALREADEEALVSRLGPLRRALLGWALRGAQRAVRDREKSKALLVRLVDRGRRAARIAGRRLRSEGRLRREDDVFFMTLDELSRVIGGAPAPLAAIERRRRRQAREGALEAPREVRPDREPPSAPAPDGDGWSGLGVSAGIGSGPARVLRAGGTADAGPGDVLVAPVLDAGLAPLLASASAAVVEMGGMLSHGAVVARELGVPCVVDVRGATDAIVSGERLLVDGGAGTVRRVSHREPIRASEEAPPIASAPSDDRPHPLEPHPQARESVYVSVLDPGSGITLIATIAVRARERGEMLIALRLGEGRVSFAVERGRPRLDASGISLGGLTIAWDGSRVDGAVRVASHDAFPPPVVPLLLSPRSGELRLALELLPSTPAVDFCALLPADARAALRPLGDHHVEQSGRWRGEIALAGKSLKVEATGHRDHSWGLRDWRALDHSRLFAVRFDDDLAVHALALSVAGRCVEGGFLWREGRLEAITAVRYAPAEESRAFDLEIATAAGTALRLEGNVVSTIAVPVEVDGRPWRHLMGRPYRLLLHEGHTRYALGARTSYGIAERTERPR